MNKPKVTVTPSDRTIGAQALEILQVVGEILLIIVQAFYFWCESIYRLIVPPPEKSVNGEIVLITGTGHGIGRELALHYASQGATVVGWDINAKNNENTIREISKLGYPKAHAYVCNVADREDVLKIAQKVRSEVGDVSILINNAGIMPCHPLKDHTAQEIERIFNINVLAHFWTLEAFLPKMLENNHGHIVALSSCAGIFGLRNLIPYCASKFAVRGLMESLFFELLAEHPNHKIKLTTIYPYMVDTGLCKNPRVRFGKAFSMLNPAEVAKFIMTTQRREIMESTIPPHFMSINNIGRLLPLKVSLLFKKFVDAGVDSDLL